MFFPLFGGPAVHPGPGARWFFFKCFFRCLVVLPCSPRALVFFPLLAVVPRRRIFLGVFSAFWRSCRAPWAWCPVVFFECFFRFLAVLPCPLWALVFFPESGAKGSLLVL